MTRLLLTRVLGIRPHLAALPAVSALGGDPVIAVLDDAWPSPAPSSTATHRLAKEQP
ncbi:hypothetical protein GCM10010430_43680 [Kitasatospora cystarginea]|uniref:Uncharacterized protein n=1 Tax=Kitasatospora cystarginea TaxID=58350 RepID=A0ABN3EDR3_9ACTN